MNVPKLRFKEFDGEWEEKKLEEISEKLTRKNKELKVTNVISNSASQGLVSQRAYFEKDIANKDNIDGYYIISKGDFVYNPRISKEAPYGPISIYHDNEDGIVSPLYTCFRILKESAFPIYLYYFFKSTSWHKYIYKNGDSGARHDRVSIKDATFFKLPVKLSTLEEQKKIGTFFEVMDKKIQLQQQKIDLLQEQKKGYMQKVFKQKINFGSDDIWQTKKVSEVATLLNGRAYKKEELLAEGKYRVLRVGNFFTNDSWYYSNLELENDKYANKGDLLYAWSASFGPQIWDDEKIIYHYHIWKVVPNEKMIERDFLYHWFDFDKERILSQKNGTTMVHITKGGLEKTDIQLPSLEQQQRISNFFNKLDERINLNKVYLKALQKQKQGFMQQMFI